MKKRLEKRPDPNAVKRSLSPQNDIGLTVIDLNVNKFFPDPTSGCFTRARSVMNFSPMKSKFNSIDNKEEMP
jgi:hypothetical protein